MRNRAQEPGELPETNRLSQDKLTKSKTTMRNGSGTSLSEYIDQGWSMLN